MSQEFSTDLTSGQYSPAANIILAIPFSAITYPAGQNQPIGPVFDHDSFVRLSLALYSPEPAGGDSGVFELTAVQPNGQKTVIATEAIYEGGISVVEELVAVKKDTQLYYSFVPGAPSETLLQAMHFAFVIESVL